ncbi:MAG TPA: caspase family protein, partial [Fibrobacteraceae bacterium]|nr:caspase family protein [Fibrobacteraceae bacterium]
MMKRLYAFSMLLAMTLLCSPSLLFATTTSIERYLLAVGANHGGKDRVTLRYATGDAQSIAKVFEEMGGVPAGHVLQLNDPTAEEFQKGLRTIATRIGEASPETRKEVVLYYSGHADEQGLLLNGTSLGWKELRKAVERLPAQVKITVLDACGSGAITRLKGGLRQPAFLVDASSDMSGYAFLTSSSENEAAQESDRIGGSYFTQVLVTGMRGAADLNHDQKVTLGEAYQFAFNETLQRTQQTSGGAQHPARDMNLTGTGDVVMTDLAQGTAVLVFAEALSGRLYVRDAQQNLVAELRKHPGRNLELGLAAGKYTVQLDHQGRWSETSISMGTQGNHLLDASKFHAVDKVHTTLRGDPDSSQVMDSLRITKSQNASHLNVNFVAINRGPWIGNQIGLLLSVSHGEMLGNQLALFGNISSPEMDGVQVGAGFNFARTIHGAQINACFNMAKRMDGVQVAPINITDEIHGSQIGSVNFARNVSDIQLSILNVAGTVENSQIGAWNTAKEVRGFQVSIWNIAGRVGRSQVGAWNIAAPVEKHQIGVWNIAGPVGGNQIGAGWNIASSVGKNQICPWNIGGKVAKNQVG